MKLLLATEGSRFSRAAIEECSEIFEGDKNTEIMVLSVAEPTFIPIEPFAVSADYVADANKAAQVNAERAVEAAEQQLRAGFPDLGDRITSRVVSGKSAQAIVEEAESWGADVIVLGSHGYGLWKRAFLGSVSNAVVHHAPCSVLVVRPARTEEGD
ncbi:MAG TPA: universal stress protein [Pyrinomonadaceae bacterium]